MLGWNDLPHQVYDPNVISNNFVDGNFDYFTETVKWATTDITHALPNSLFLTAAPGSRPAERLGRQHRALATKNAAGALSNMTLLSAPGRSVG